MPPVNRLNLCHFCNLFLTVEVYFDGMFMYHFVCYNFILKFFTILSETRENFDVFISS